MLLPFAPFGGRCWISLLFGPTNKEDMGLFLLKVPLGISKHVQQLQERGLNLVHVKVNNEQRKEVWKELENKVCAHLNMKFNSKHRQPLDPLYHI